MSVNEYQVTGMTCSHCERAVHGAVSEVSGVTDVAVSASDGRLVVTAAGPLDDDAVRAAVTDAGYAVADAGYDAARV